MSATSPVVGQIIELNDGRLATIRFQGATGFAPGQWVGVELEDATGKNDGSVKGDRYFDCEANYGMFLRTTGIKRIIEDTETQEKPPSKATSTGGATGRGRPSTVGIGGGRAALLNGGKRVSIAASPTPSRGSVAASARAFGVSLPDHIRSFPVLTVASRQSDPHRRP